MERVICIIQARMGSTRLPGKVALDLGGKSMLERVVERARLIDNISEVVVATSDQVADEEVVSLSAQIPVPCYRGSESDVLARYMGAATEYAADSVIRITADCPLLDPGVSSEVLSRFLDKRPHYASNILNRTYPRGLDTECVAFEPLKDAFNRARDASDREHVTRFIWRQPNQYRLLSVEGEADLSHHRWTVDTDRDLLFVRKIFEHFEVADIPRWTDVLSLLKDHPRWIELNSDVAQKEA